MNEQSKTVDAPLPSGKSVRTSEAEELQQPRGWNLEPDYERETSLLELMNVLLRWWRMVLGFPFIAAAVTAGLLLFVPPTFTATVVFVPEAGQGTRLPSGLAGLAGQFGFSLGGEAGQTPEFYAEVLKSREIIDRVLLTRFADPRASASLNDSSTLLELLGVDGDHHADSLYRARTRLMELISVPVDISTGIVRLKVDSRYPHLASAAANAFVYYLNGFNAETRQSQAQERRKFVEERLSAEERELKEAEEDLKAFYERNRSWQQSPQLVVEEDRLRRQVQIRQEVYVTLKREYETARIEEVNDTPVITIIDAAVPPQEKSKPKRLLLVSLALAIGGTVGILGALIGEYLDRMRQEHEGEYREFRSLLNNMRDDLRRMIRGRFGRRGTTRTRTP